MDEGSILVDAPGGRRLTRGPGLLRSAAVQIAHPSIEWPVLARSRAGNQMPGVPSRDHIENTAAMLDAYGISVRWNTMRHTLELAIPGFAPSVERAENAGLARVVELGQRNGLSGVNVIDHLQTLAVEYHPVADWIASRSWDGQDRVDALLATVMVPDGADVALAAVLLRRWLVSCARAVMPQPSTGRRFTPQGVLVFQGPQGIGKTEWLKALAPPAADWILTGRTVDPHNRDSVQQVTGYWIVELGELDATYRKADISALKAFVTQEVDVYRAAYARREERIPRRTILGASVNPRYFLVDDTGNRRWWTVPVGALEWRHGIDVQQLWAQVAADAEDGAAWWLDADEQARLAATNADHEAPDPVVDDLWTTWEIVPVSSIERSPRVTLADVWSAMPGRENRPRTRYESATLANALRLAGAENDTLTHGSRTYRVRRTGGSTANAQTRRDING